MSMNRKCKEVMYIYQKHEIEYTYDGLQFLYLELFQDQYKLSSGSLVVVFNLSSSS